MFPAGQNRPSSFFRKFKSNPQPPAGAETAGAALTYPSTKKKRKLSGLTGMELQLAYTSLLKLKSALVYEESEETEDPDEPAPETFERQVDTMIALLGSRLEGPEVWLTLSYDLAFH
jgi:hypothetical protein